MNRVIEIAVSPPVLAGAMIVVLMALTGCGTDRDFDAAAHANTTSAWQAYLRAHPDGTRSAEARARLTASLEAHEWQLAHTAGTPDAYLQYLHTHPQGQHAQDALVAIANLNLGKPPTENTPAPAPGAGSAPGATSTAEPARPAPADGGFRVQLGAFTAGRAAAAAAWQRLAVKYPELRDREPSITAAVAADRRPIQRLQLAGLDRTGAAALCHTLAAGHDPCIVVPPRKAGDD